MEEQRISMLEKEVADLKQQLKLLLRDQQYHKEITLGDRMPYSKYGGDRYVEVRPKLGEKLTKVVVYYA